MKKRFPGKELTVDDFQSCYDPKAERDSLSEIAFVFTAYSFSIYQTDKWDLVYQRMGKKSVETAKTSYEDALKKYGTDNRKEIVGDNPLDINDTHYGNNVLLTSDAATGVMKAGVIAAKRDPGRVALVASHFENKECEVESREFKTITGTYKGKRITVVSTGIGCDNIDIVMNELDALANIDFVTREEKDQFRQLELVRIGTCGGLQPNTPVGTFVCSQKSIGFDGLLNFYAGRNAVCDLPFERAFLNHMGWSGNMCAPAPYVIDASEELIDRIAKDDMVRGVTIAAGGFFGPQGRELRIPLADPKQNDKIEAFEYKGYKITNFEMESSALAGLSRLMGHKAMTVCMVIANRLIKEANTGYKNTIDTLIKTVLDRI